MELYRDLDVWKYGIQLVEEIYRIAQKLPKEELYGLGGQISLKDVVDIPTGTKQTSL